jgi:hypothetical protein
MHIGIFNDPQHSLEFGTRVPDRLVRRHSDLSRTVIKMCVSVDLQVKYAYEAGDVLLDSYECRMMFPSGSLTILKNLN